MKLNEFDNGKKYKFCLVIEIGGSIILIYQIINSIVSFSQLASVEYILTNFTRNETLDPSYFTNTTYLFQYRILLKKNYNVSDIIDLKSCSNFVWYRNTQWQGFIEDGDLYFLNQLFGWKDNSGWTYMTVFAAIGFLLSILIQSVNQAIALKKTYKNDKEPLFNYYNSLCYLLKIWYTPAIFTVEMVDLSKPCVSLGALVSNSVLVMCEITIFLLILIIPLVILLVFLTRKLFGSNNVISDNISICSACNPSDPMFWLLTLIVLFITTTLVFLGCSIILLIVGFFGNVQAKITSTISFANVLIELLKTRFKCK